MGKTTTWKEIRGRRIKTEEEEREVRRHYELHELALRLAALRKDHGVTQARLAKDLAVTQANVSRIERERDLKLSTIDGYVAALGGRLEIRAVFPDNEWVTLSAADDDDETEPVGSTPEAR